MIKVLLRQKLKNKFPEIDFDVLTPPNPETGDYSTNIAFILAKKYHRSPEEVGKEIIEEIERDGDIQKVFERIEFAKPGFINFYLKDDFLRKQMRKIGSDKSFGYNETMKGKTVMVEYTDPNPFKLFHIGHLMSNTIGEAITRLYEASGARVLRANYQGDVGLHAAKTIWAILISPAKDSFPEEDDQLEKKIEYLGEAYAVGARSYEENEEAKTRIEEINKKIYDRSDESINKAYDLGKKWSLEYFETIYKKLGTKFDHYFFESETGKDGLEVISENKKVFTESEGALIFKGEDYGLHNRVFVNAKGLPTYEAKELGLNKKKFDLYSPNLSIIVTGNEINDYFKVVLKVMELIMPEIAKKTCHIGHGMMRFSSGKMSSRTGNVITAESLIEQVISKIKIKEQEAGSAFKKTEKEYESLAVSAVKYMILKHSIGSDIIFDFERALSIKGDAAPYLQYTYARLRSIGRNSKKINRLSIRFAASGFEISSWIWGLGIDLSKLTEEKELMLIRHILNFSDIVEESAGSHNINDLALYLYKLAARANNYYENVRILDNKTKTPQRNARLLLVETAARVLKRGLNLLGIETLEKL